MGTGLYSCPRSPASHDRECWWSGEWEKVATTVHTPAFSLSVDVFLLQKRLFLLKGS